jgi:hypothetical protein
MKRFVIVVLSLLWAIPAIGCETPVAVKEIVQKGIVILQGTPFIDELAYEREIIASKCIRIDPASKLTFYAEYTKKSGAVSKPRSAGEAINGAADVYTAGNLLGGGGIGTLLAGAALILSAVSTDNPNAGVYNLRFQIRSDDERLIAEEEGDLRANIPTVSNSRIAEFVPQWIRLNAAALAKKASAKK